MSYTVLVDNTSTVGLQNQNNVSGGRASQRPTESPFEMARHSAGDFNFEETRSSRPYEGMRGQVIEIRLVLDEPKVQQQVIRRTQEVHKKTDVSKTETGKRTTECECKPEVKPVEQKTPCEVKPAKEEPKKEEPCIPCDAPEDKCLPTGGFQYQSDAKVVLDYMIDHAQVVTPQEVRQGIALLRKIDGSEHHTPNEADKALLKKLGVTDEAVTVDYKTGAKKPYIEYFLSDASHRGLLRNLLQAICKRMDCATNCEGNIDFKLIRDHEYYSKKGIKQAISEDLFAHLKIEKKSDRPEAEYPQNVAKK